jgi:hypothetical protein
MKSNHAATLQRISLPRSDPEKKIPARLRSACIRSYQIRPEVLHDTPNTWKELDKPKLSFLNFEHMRKMQKVKNRAKQHQTPNKKPKFVFESLRDYDSPLP